jgi:superoxide dismutase, Cu-Zn family
MKWGNKFSAALIMAGFLAVPATAEIFEIGKSGASAAIISAEGVPVGSAKASDSKKNGLRIELTVKGLPRGEHAVHIHEKGQCVGPDFASAGAHWNPGAKQHGTANPAGPHAGDLPNMLVDKKGRGKLKFDLTDERLWKRGGMMDEDGAAIVIHAQSDDNRTDPSGNSGGRIACGVFVRK